ncbi:MAG: cytochrome c [Nitrospirae bacterium]|nr:cytochrome c [Nitrospirota bacterium]
MMRSALVVAAVLVCLTLVSSAVTFADGLDGFAIYEAKCAKCHNGIGSTTIPGRSYSRIKSSIRTNIGGMAMFRDMKDEELKAVSDVLLVSGDPEDVDGKKLYAVLCSGCHRGIENSTIKGKTSDDIRAAAKENMCRTDHAKVLDDTLIEKLAGVLKQGAGAPVRQNERT